MKGQGRNGAPRVRLHIPALLAVAWLAALPAMAQSPPLPPASPSPAPMPAASATSGDETLDNAVAAVLVAALVEQVDTPSIAVNIDSFHVTMAGLRERNVSGQGRLRVGDDADWIGFRYGTVYDATFASAGYPRITIGGVVAGEREVPNDASLVRQLEDRVAGELDAQLGRRATRLQLDDIGTFEGGRRLLRISALGIADFGPGGSTPVRIEALYDRIDDAWRRVDYALGAAVP